jgi:Putative lumazine-binding
MRATLLLSLMLIATSLSAQSEKDVLEPINKLFTGMSLGDSAMVHAAFTHNVIMTTVLKDKNGNPALRQGSINDFLKAVGTPNTEKWNEPIWDTKVQVDGHFAQVWTSYAFYLGKNFIHCGVDAFHLFKGTDGKWRIFSLADTRQKEGCSVPQTISDQFK